MAQKSAQPSERQGTSAAFNAVKVFSATMVADRAQLGERVTEWIARHPTYKIVEIVTTQSSDHQFHCIALTVFYVQPVSDR